MSVTIELEPKDVVEEAIKKVRDDASTDVNWILLGYVEGKPATLSLSSKGSGGVSELAQKLDDNLALYGYLRVNDNIDGNAVTKFVLIQWIGSGVKTLTRGRLSTHLPPVKTLLKHHVCISAADKNEVTERSVIDKVSDASGSGNRVLVDGRRGSSGSTSNPSSPTTLTTAQKRKSLSSTELKFVNPDAVKAALTELRNTSSIVDHVLLAYEGETDDLSLAASGPGGLTAVHEKLSVDNVIYGLLRVTEKTDNVSSHKFVLLTWVGDQVKVMRKARVTTHQGGVQTLIGQFHVALTVSDKGELTEASIKGKLSEGSRTGDASPRASSPSPGGKQQPATGGFVRRMSDTPLSRKSSGSNLVPGNAAAITFPDEKAVKDAVAEVRKGPANWVLLGYEGSSSIVVRGKGTGGVAELVSNLSEEKVLYGLVRKEEETDGQKRIKFAYIFWVGDKVAFVAKAKITPHKGELNKVLEPYHTEIYATTLVEVTDEIISQKLKAA